MVSYISVGMFAARIRNIETLALYRGNRNKRPKIRIRKDATADRAQTVGVGLRNTSLQKVGSAVRESHRQNRILPRDRSIDLFEPFIIEACLIQRLGKRTNHPQRFWSAAYAPRHRPVGSR